MVLPDPKCHPPWGYPCSSCQDCYPYSWWRLEALPEWAGGELMCLGALPWKYTEYPSLYGGPCNVNRDASVKPTDAVIFLYVHADSPSYRRAINAAASSWRYCCSPGCVQQDPFDFRCEVCLVSTRTAADFAAHKAGKIHRKRVALEDCWEAALRASQGRSLMEVTCNLHGPAETEEVHEAVQLSWASRLFWWAFAYCPCLPKKENGIIYFAMPRVQVQPIASSLLEVDVPENGNVETLKQALFEKTEISICEQRLVVRGKLLEDATLVSSIEGRIFLARAAGAEQPSSPATSTEEVEEITLVIKMVGKSCDLRITTSLDRLARDLKQEVMDLLSFPPDLGYKFVAKGRLIGEVWNADLAHACEVRVWHHMSKGSSKEFMWRKAHQAILAVDKEIRQFSSGRVVNMPKIKEVTTLHELEAIIRGEKAIVPPEMQQAAEPPERDYAQHPYLKRMQFRGGGYAILMALHLRSNQTGHRQFMYKSEILHDAQPFCDGIMEGPFGGREEYRLTQEGISFIEAMLELWPEQRNASVDHAVGQEEFTQGSQAIEMTPAVETTQVAPGHRRPRWAAQTFRVCTAPTPLSKRRRSEGYVNVESIDISSESEFERPSCCEASDGNAGQQESQVVLLVDDRERLRNLEPRRFFESIAAEAMACRHHLKLGDFAWVLQPASPATPAHCLESASMSLNHCPLVNLVVERKRIADLVGRSAVGDHLKQLRRMEDSALQHLFFLIEGNLKHASNCTVYDTEMAEMESICLGSKEDIDAFCAKLIVLGSKVGVLQTKDSAGTVRLLKNISAWLAWTLCSDKQSEKHGALLTSCTLQNLQTVPAGPQALLAHH
eukprot:symbB.v1.2.006223.t3/scaffold340.1/size245066/9